MANTLSGNTQGTVVQRAPRRRDRHLSGHALVRAALDLARCGLDGPLPMELLLRVHVRDTDVRGMDRELVKAARAWAAERRYGLHHAFPGEVRRMLHRLGKV
ncbi:hypothetical protein [Streptomyces sp. NPDC048650]|uniref:hypothetical protein n=1 Tax=unclassified Streptomyces TaxID=2593676 RepID=UPI00371EDE48